MRLAVWFWSPPLSHRASRVAHQLFGLLTIGTLVFSFPEPVSFYWGESGLFAPPSFSGASLWGNLMFALAWMAALGLSAGYYLRFFTAVALLWHMTVFHLFALAGWHLDAMMVALNFSLFFLPSPCSETRRKDSTAPAPGLRYVQLYLSFVYLVSALAKLKLPTWRSGEAISHFFASWLVEVTLSFPAFFALGIAWGVMVGELALAFLLWFPRTQKLAFRLALLFHGSVFFFTKIKWFSVVMLCSHLCYAYRWVPDLAGKQVGRRLQTRIASLKRSLRQRST